LRLRLPPRPRNAICDLTFEDAGEATHRREARLELGRLPSSGGGSGEEDEDDFALRHCVEFVQLAIEIDAL